MPNSETAELWRLIRGYIGDIEIVERLLASGADVKTRDERGRTILHCAVEHIQSLECLKLLVSADADYQVVDPEYGTLIQNAMVHYGYNQGREITRFFADLGIPDDSKTIKGQTWLHLASAVTEDDNWARDDKNDFSRILEIELKTFFIDVHDDDNVTPLHYAASVSEFNVARLLQTGANPAILTSRGASALHIACLARQPNIVGLLLSEYERRGVLGEFVDLLDGDVGRSPLHYACRSGRPESVRYLLSHGADAHVKDVNGFTPILALAEFSIEERLWDSPMVGAVRLMAHLTILSDGFRPAGIRAPIRYRDPERIVEILDLLVGSGVQLDGESQVSDMKDTPMASAVRNNCTEMVRELARRGVKYPDSTSPFEPNIDESIQRLLNIEPEGIVSGVFDLLCDANYDALEAFVRKGGDLTVPDRLRNNTPLHTLAEGGYAFLLEAFKKKAAQVDHIGWMKEEDNPGTLLGRACFRKLPNLHVLKTLIEKVCLDLNEISNPRGYIYKLAHATPLHIIACGRNFWNVEAVKYLLQRGANIEARNHWGQTPLLAALSGAYPNGFWKEETARVLLEHGADPNAQSTNWERATCLQLSDSAAITRLLLQHGADMKKSTGALTVSVERMDLETAQALLDAGQDPNLCARLRYPLHEAARRPVEKQPPSYYTRQSKMINLLLDRGADPLAVYPNEMYVLQAIIEEHGVVDPFFTIPGLDFEQRGFKGRTLLISACIPRKPPHEHTWNSPGPPAVARPETILKLIEYGADVSAIDDTGRSSLHWLCTMTSPYDESHKRAWNAIAQGSQINPRDLEGSKPIHLALDSHQPWAVDQLLQLGSGIEPDPRGNTALHHYAHRLEESVFLEGFQKSLALGVDINAPNQEGETALFVFMATGGMTHIDKLPLFMDAGADIFTTNKQGETLLHAIVRRKIKCPWINGNEVDEATQCFKYLLRLGLNPYQEDGKQRSAIDIAATRDLRTVAGLFQSKAQRVVEMSDEENDDESVNGNCCEGEKTYSDDGYCLIE